MIIHRTIQERIARDLTETGKIILIYGPRQSGKTTLANQIIQRLGLRTLYVNADQLKYIELLMSRDLRRLKGLVEGYEMIFIDEGQRIPEIGINLKILHDEIPALKIMVTGSSSFLLSAKISESLAGRKRIYTLLPVSEQELAYHFNPFERQELLDSRIIFGSYPEVINTANDEDKTEYLSDISESLIIKDILDLENIRYPLKIRELLMLLSYQIGSQVSIHELCNQLKLNRDTIERYLFLLEQAFVIFKLPALSRNPRKEISKSHKYYFYDTGIRNIVIDQMKPLHQRGDTGALWENFMISERIKYLYFNRINANYYFWRSYSGAEIDYVEEVGEQVTAYEIKLSKGKSKPPPSWDQQYRGAYRLINKTNYSDFLI